MPGAPRKRFGQHFLADRGVIGRIVDALALTGSETVLEIGPGRGALTDQLAERAARVIAIEIDRDLVRFLRERYADRPHVRVEEGDALATPLEQRAGGPFVLAGNLPYYISTPLLFHALSAPRPERAVFLLQREVGERLAAQPATDAYGALTVNAGVVAASEIVSRVRPGAFFPRPRVDSAIVRVTPLATPMVE